MYLLTADLHLDDQPANAYRWQIFEHVNAARTRYEVSRIFVLGDFVDRKDRHSAAFVNRLFAELDPDWVILRGNHDTTLRPPAYFEFLPNYISEPTAYFGGLLRPVDTPGVRLLLLPFTPNPSEDWATINMNPFDAVFMHATVSGAVVDHGIVLENPSFPELPQHVKFYSGDVHHPQRVRNVTYVGAPHPTKFGDDYACRMLLLDESTFDIVEVIELSPPRKLMVDVATVDDVARIKARPGDQIKLRINLAPGAVDSAAMIDAQIAAWAEDKGVIVMGVETIVDTVMASGVDIGQAPQAILREFALHEKLSDDMLATGIGLLEEVA